MFNRFPLGVDLMPGVWMRDNVVIIELYTFIKSHTGLNEMLETVKRIKNNWIIDYWCFDYSAECWEAVLVNDTFEDIFKIFQEKVVNPLISLGINTQAIHMIHGDLHITQKYMSSEYKRGSVGSVAGIARFFNLYHKQFSRIEPIPANVPPRNYVSFNRRRTLFRQRLWEHLSKNNLLDKGYSTFRFENYSNLSYDLDVEYENKDHVLTENILSGFYKVCNYEIVVETVSDSNNDKLFITEKTIRPLAHGVPFILYAAPHTLHTLHSYGFKTYSDLWDESYDSIQDNDQRFNCITNLINKLTPDFFEQHRPQLNEIGQHNSKRFLEIASQDYRDAWYIAINKVNFFERIQQGWSTATRDIMVQQCNPALA